MRAINERFKLIIRAFVVAVSRYICIFNNRMRHQGEQDNLLHKDFKGSPSQYTLQGWFKGRLLSFNAFNDSPVAILLWPIIL